MGKGRGNNYLRFSYIFKSYNFLKTNSYNVEILSLVQKLVPKKISYKFSITPRLYYLCTNIFLLWNFENNAKLAANASMFSWHTTILTIYCRVTT